MSKTKKAAPKKKPVLKQSVELSALPKRVSPVEKALKLSNEQVIAKAISDMLKRDDEHIN